MKPVSTPAAGRARTRSGRRSRLRALAVGLVAAGPLALVAPALLLLLSAHAREFVYRQVSYQLVADRAAGTATDPEAIARRLSDYVADGLYPGGGPVIDATPWLDLVRGVAWCDQQDTTLATLLAKKGIHARLAFMRDYRGGGPHVMVEVRLHGRWRAFDPYYDLVFEHPRTRALASLEDLSADRSIIFDQPAVRALPLAAKRRVVEFFTPMFPVRHGPLRWGSMLETIDRGLARWSVNRLIRLALAAGGAPLAGRFQDLYLARLPDRLPSLHEAGRSNAPVLRTRAEDPALFLYYRARNYHLYARAALAEALYREVLRDHPDSPYAEKSLFFLGLLALESPGDPGAARTRLAEYRARYPRSDWRSLADYWLGVAEERGGDVEAAREHYRRAADDPLVMDAASRLAQLR